jgi:glycosyltransferase involved in cell wall biosynthesis
MDRYASVFVGHSETNLNAFFSDWRTDPKRYRLVPNAVPMATELPDRERVRAKLGIAAHETVLLHVGSFRAEKNHRGLLHIARRIVQGRRNIKLVLVGDGPLREAVEREVDRLHLHAFVRFEGAQFDVWPYYAAADVFVFPSLSEGFGNVLVESQASRLPVVASDISAHRESVAPAQHRFLFPLDDHDMAARLVLEQIDAPAASKEARVSDSAAYAKRQFSLDRHALQLADLYREMTSVSSARRARAA